jgi:hypothetical protein
MWKPGVYTTLRTTACLVHRPGPGKEILSNIYSTMNFKLWYMIKSGFRNRNRDGTGRNRIHLGSSEPEPYLEYGSSPVPDTRKWSKQLPKNFAKGLMISFSCRYRCRYRYGIGIGIDMSIGIGIGVDTSIGTSILYMYTFTFKTKYTYTYKYSDMYMSMHV